MRFRDIEQYPSARYEVDVSWKYMESNLDNLAQMDLNLDPDFQRPYVWTVTQQSAFVEYMLRGGEGAKFIMFNAPNWRHVRGPIELIDGKQRLEAARAFKRDEVPVFGGYTCSDLGGVEALGHMVPRFRFQMFSLSRVEVLKWYIAFNRGGSIHTDEEIARVQALLVAEETQ